MKRIFPTPSKRFSPTASREFPRSLTDRRALRRPEGADSGWLGRCLPSAFIVPSIHLHTHSHCHYKFYPGFKFQSMAKRKHSEEPEDGDPQSQATHSESQSSKPPKKKKKEKKEKKEKKKERMEKEEIGGKQEEGKGKGREGLNLSASLAQNLGLGQARVSGGVQSILYKQATAETNQGLKGRSQAQPAAGSSRAGGSRKKSEETKKEKTSRGPGRPKAETFTVATLAFLNYGTNINFYLGTSEEVLTDGPDDGSHPLVSPQLLKEKVPDSADLDNLESLGLVKYGEFVFHLSWTHEEVAAYLRQHFPRLFEYIFDQQQEIPNSHYDAKKDPESRRFLPPWCLCIKRLRGRTSTLAASANHFVDAAALSRQLPSTTSKQSSSSNILYFAFRTHLTPAKLGYLRMDRAPFGYMIRDDIQLDKPSEADNSSSDSESGKSSDNDDDYVDEEGMGSGDEEDRGELGDEEGYRYTHGPAMHSQPHSGSQSSAQTGLEQEFEDTHLAPAAEAGDDSDIEVLSAPPSPIPTRPSTPLPSASFPRPESFIADPTIKNIWG
ncbi:hypothetical protein BXZ70DRAFT_954971 [Cristinia sonorae]|uniref:Uncharacterized protein n=1 Tax=Cristinia sonorae TaxID=1940300 RepID=A0A8K0UEY4_9AGAR|nr:hypothetical protein BXZ70DRAFT_960707 [Cristinia sonorae]KAH8088951.1 hypothetical protein BXZ70DRAFT_954971 [Cristinia sonorae]